MTTNTPQNTPIYDATTGFLTDYGKSIGKPAVQPNDPAKSTPSSNSGGVDYTAANAAGIQNPTAAQAAAAEAAQKTSIANSGASTIPFTTTDANGNITLNTGNPTIDSLGNALITQINTSLSQGNKVNPNLQITPALVSQFLSEAHSQMDPEGQQNLTDAIDGINSSLSNLQTQYENSTAEQQSQFEQSLGSERNSAGANGIAFSGTRGLTENYMLGSENRSLASLGSTYANNVGNTLRSGAAAVGNNSLGLNGNTSNFNIPTDLNTYTSTLEGARGGVGANGSALNTNYDPSNYQIGSIPSAYGTALTGSANNFLSNYLSSADNNSRTFQDLNGTPTLS